jgi:DEAD/DEAH box helicase domain-containing protein
MLMVLEENGVIRLSGDNYHWADQSYPAEGVSLRSATTDNVVIVDRTDGADTVIGEMDRPSAKELLFDNAIYIHRGEQFVVTGLDIENRRCYVERTDVNYFTDALLKLDVKVLTEDEETPVRGTSLILGDVLVRSLAAKFKKIRFQSHENVGYGEIDLPEEQMHTRAAMVVLRAGLPARDAFDALPPAARPVALNRLARLLRDVAPVYLMSVVQDLGVFVTVRDPHFEEPALYLYDRYPGGSGLSDALPRVLDHVLAAAWERVSIVTVSPVAPPAWVPSTPTKGGAEIRRVLLRRCSRHGSGRVADLYTRLKELKKLRESRAPGDLSSRAATGEPRQGRLPVAADSVIRRRVQSGTGLPRASGSGRRCTTCTG